MIDIKISCLPGCMEPDGADPCKAYLELFDKANELQAKVKELESWQEFVRYNSKEAAYMADDHMLTIANEVKK